MELYIFLLKEVVILFVPHKNVQKIIILLLNLFFIFLDCDIFLLNVHKSIILLLFLFLFLMKCTIYIFINRTCNFFVTHKMSKNFVNKLFFFLDCDIFLLTEYEVNFVTNCSIFLLI